MVKALETRPRSVAILALGPSSHDYFNATCSKKDFLKPDEVWVINSAINAIKADKAFIMDDLKRMQNRFPQWCSDLKTTDVPIITSKRYKEYPTSVSYPIEEICECVKDDVFTTSVAYAIGYAIYTNVEDLYLFGCDFWYPGSAAREPGGEAVSYLLGIAKERGMNFKIPQSSTLLDANMTKLEDGKMRRPLYGYDYNPGESRERVMKGNATELDKQVAHKAPYMNKLDGGKDAQTANP